MAMRLCGLARKKNETKGGRITLLDEVIDIRHGGNVKRHHNYPIIGEQRVAAHTWGMLVLAERLYYDEFIESSQLVMGILYHDVAEYKTGDIPANAKWASPLLTHELDILKQKAMKLLRIAAHLSKTEERILKICDYLELALFSLEQRTMGNSYSDRPFWKIMDRLEKYAPWSVTEASFIESLKAEYRRLQLGNL